MYSHTKSTTPAMMLMMMMTATMMMATAAAASPSSAVAAEREKNDIILVCEENTSNDWKQRPNYTLCQSTTKDIKCHIITIDIHVAHRTLCTLLLLLLYTCIAPCKCVRARDVCTLCARVNISWSGNLYLHGIPYHISLTLSLSNA